MALRVLLADESTTIKKVIQLALQDYGVEVKTVPIGLDVVPVAKTFQPDLVFIDVLLQKKSGYEVSKELKEDPEMKSVPVVLMWSGFMEVDEAKVQASLANARLEKPFDADILRKLVRDLVPKTADNKVSSYLAFPKLPEFSEESPKPTPKQAAPNAKQSPTHAPPILAHGEVKKPSEEKSELPDFPSAEFGNKEDDSLYNIPEVNENDMLVGDLPPSDEDEFSNIPLSATKEPTLGPDEAWSHQDLSKFKIEIPPEDENSLVDDLDKFMIHPEDLDNAQVESNGDFEEVTFARPPQTEKSSRAAQHAPSQILEDASVPSPNYSGVKSAMDQVLAEKILREESQAVLEKVLWQILPDICERVVREELNKLLKDVERSI